MLRITVHEDAASWRLQLEGKLTCAWVAEAQKIWASARVPGKRLEVDLTGVTAVDDAGWNFLDTLNRAGARFIAEGVEMKALVGEVTSGSGQERSWKNIRRYLSLLVLAFVLGPLSLRAQDAVPAPVRLTLKDAVAIALRQNPQVAIANLNLAQSQQNSTIARAGLLPQISLAAADQVSRQNLEAFLGRKIPGFPAHSGPFWTIQAGPRFSVPLIDLSLWNRWQASREAVNTSAARETTAREMNAQLVVSQYLGGLRAAADVEAARARLDLAKALFDLAGDLQENGVGTGIDTLRANVEYQNERQRVAQAETQLKISLYALNRLLNLDPRQTVEVADEPSFFETPPFGLDSSLEQAYQARPEMKTVLSEIRTAELRKRASQDQRLPRLSIGGGWSLLGVTPTRMIPSYQYAASFDVPLFTGGRIAAETAAADIEIRKLRQTEREVRNQIALEVKTAAAQLESARTEVDAASLGVNLAKESVRQAQDRFRAGVANNIEVITAQNELARANDNQITALYRYNQARADLARATGRMEALYAR